MESAGRRPVLGRFPERGRSAGYRLRRVRPSRGFSFPAAPGVKAAGVRAIPGVGPLAELQPFGLARSARWFSFPAGPGVKAAGVGGS